MDSRKNFAFGILAAGIDSAATELSVGASEGLRFSAVPFNAVIWNTTDYKSPAHAYVAGEAEVVRITAIVTDALTITRAQEGTTAVALNTADKVYEIWAGPTALLFDGIDALLNSSGVGSPEGSITKSPGAFRWDPTNEILYVKDTGTGNTGWIQILKLPS